MGVNNLPRVAARQRTVRESKSRPLNHESNALPLHYRVILFYITLHKCLLNSLCRHGHYCYCIHSVDSSSRVYCRIEFLSVVGFLSYQFSDVELTADTSV